MAEALVTTRTVTVMSEPACHPRYAMCVPIGTRCKKLDTGEIVVEEISKVIGGNAHDLEHYYVRVPRSAFA